jgi:hypothetical protein
MRRDKMSKEDVEKEIGVKITENEHEHLQMFYSDKIDVIELLRVLSNYRYRKLQDYENKIYEIFNILKKLQMELSVI